MLAQFSTSTHTPSIESVILATCPLAWIVRDDSGATLAAAANYPPPEGAIASTAPIAGGTVTWFLYLP